MVAYSSFSSSEAQTTTGMPGEWEWDWKDSGSSQQHGDIPEETSMDNEPGFHGAGDLHIPLTASASNFARILAYKSSESFQDRDTGNQHSKFGLPVFNGLFSHVYPNSSGKKLLQQPNSSEDFIVISSPDQDNIPLHTLPTPSLHQNITEDVFTSDSLNLLPHYSCHSDSTDSLIDGNPFAAEEPFGSLPQNSPPLFGGVEKPLPPIPPVSTTDAHRASEFDNVSPQRTIPNIILFGASGCGKTSIVNMLAGTELARTVSNSAVSVLFHNQVYEIKIEDQYYNIYDTTGLSEGYDQSSLSQQVNDQLKNLVYNLNDGVHLLVFCLRAPRITDGAASNYVTFYRSLCGSKVPIVLVVTGLENEVDMDDWWDINENVFKGYGMHFEGHACITATRGKKMASGYKYQTEYDESREKTVSLIQRHVRKPEEGIKIDSVGTTSLIDSQTSS
ncbi:hypothetical protein VKT23_013786 [Stygiomarasmius scandens]|uniref:G domain-containing protein n=1 Tax=Marasmiellus scandens TaxID=2682957 RepID=A0ABR1J5X4_9AGAR